MSMAKSESEPLTGAEKEKRAKAYGHAHGFKGDAGGWIRRADGSRFCQGWQRFYDRMADRIEALRAHP